MMTSADQGLQPFHAMEIMAAAQRLEQQGRHICHLEVGEPAVPPAPGVLAAVAASLPGAQRYTHAKGRKSLREGLAALYRRDHGVEVDPEQILVTMGSSAGFIVAFLAGFRPGARIAVTRPGYPAYLNILRSLGFEPVEIALSADEGWHLHADLIEKAYRNQPFEGLLFASPANPTGATADRATLRAIVECCRRLGVTLVSDEIYHGLSFSDPLASALEFTTDALVVNSFSKRFCMTGWRVGWLVLPAALLRRAEILQQNLFISAPSLSQIAAEAALDELGYAEAQVSLYAQNRGLITGRLRALGFGEVRAADGAFYAYVDCSPFSGDSMQFCLDLLAHAGVAATPGIDFDRVDGHRYLRFSYAGATATVAEALDRIERFLRSDTGRRPQQQA